ncbi:hypothetical protein JAAARDRAFT_190345 [Jaapia argillacea MUCL 33604]|uniref:Uncharacterized protein n=1 Tax=Jaapia argillacea MUCL 33604 TaxID=933084 RepID=A0A067Q602_9AGAM|nr:hypothetical protein JAAARDRAFT_190345 [Jaapia argillacea MUCL 33604]
MAAQSTATSATQAKDRHYAHLASSLIRLNQAVGQTADLFEQLQIDLDAMRMLAGWHTAQFIAVASDVDHEPLPEDNHTRRESS